MEVQGIVFRPIPCFSGADFVTRNLNPSFSGLSVDAGNRLAGDLRLLGSRDSKVSVKPRKYPGFSSFGFSDDGHRQYYVSPRSGGKKKEKEKGSKMTSVKKRLKLIKGLKRDLSMFSGLGFGMETVGGLIGEVKGKMISEATEVLLAQLQQLRAEEKELNKKRKEEKAKLKATRMKARVDCESSSNSSFESSDSECEEVVDMSRLRSKALTQSKIDEPQQEIQEAVSSTSPSLLIQQQNIMELKVIEDCTLQNHGEECCTGIDTSCTSRSSVVVGALADRIEVCMGGKCKKSGAAALLEEFERRVDGAVVVGCKCMGKCRDGPNVRVLNGCDGIQAEGSNVSLRFPANPLCIGVGLEDVSTIVANFFGEDKKNLSLMAASSLSGL